MFDEQGFDYQIGEDGGLYEIQTIPCQDPVEQCRYQFRITLQHMVAGDEQLLEFELHSDNFCVVMNEIDRLRPSSIWKIADSQCKDRLFDEADLF
jgi:hypothetical protein